MSKNFKSLTDILNKEKEFDNFRKKVKELDVINDFEKIFPELSKTVKAKNVNNGVIFLKVENSVLRSELFRNKELFVEKINKHFNQKIIVDAKFLNF